MRVFVYFVSILARVLYFAILARVIVSWLPIDRNNAIIRVLYEVTEPILGPIRRVLPFMGGLDLSPLIALIVIQVAERVLIALASGF
ncbi:MAG TPA: YggT family protein [Chloroflexi bacterium]|jgi:YggT family protein|nr:YggT family protein [Chloroflexota bacterium]